VLVFALLRSPPRNILSWDTFGYYLYLPAGLLHHDLALEDQQWVQEVITTYHSTESFYQARSLPEGRWVMKYPMGLAVLWSPFFVVGHLVAGVSGHPQDGFSAPYQWSIIGAMLAYLLAGLLVLRRVLMKYFSDAIVAAVLALIVLGTNYLHQALYSTGMPHLFLFTLYAGVLWHSIRWHERHRMRDAIILAVLIGLLALSRPSEIVAVFIPLLIGLAHPAQWMDHVRALWRWRSQFALVIGIMLLIGSPQLIYWKWLTGKFLYMSYNNPGEGFEFLHPYIAEVLFSFRKGWYIYTPLMVVATAGLFLMRRHLSSLSWSIIAFFVLNLYIVSSWSCWWYADSFGQRALVQSYAVMALPLGAVLAWLAGRHWLWRSSGVVALIALTAFNLFQIWQSAQGMIHTSRMTEAAYRAVFAKTTAPAGQDTLLLVDHAYPVGSDAPDLRRYKRMPLVLMRSGPRGRSSPVLRIPYDRLTAKDHVWLEVDCWIDQPDDRAMPFVSLVTSFEHGGYDYAYQEMWTDTTKRAAGARTHLVTWYLTPEIRRPSDELVVRCRSDNDRPIYIDDLGVTVYEPLNAR